MAKRKFKTHLLNIKVAATPNIGPDAYGQLFTRIFENKTLIKVRGGKHMIFRTQRRLKTDSGSIIFGQIAKATKIENDNWLNIEELSVTHHKISRNFFPNLVETDYFFIPAAHRLVIRKSSSFSPKSVQEFLNAAIPQVLGPEAGFSVHIEQARDAIDQILDATAVKSLTVRITPTNRDINTEAAAHVDEQITRLRAAVLSIDAKAEENGQLDISQSDLIEGALDLSQSNGSAEARIVDMEGKHRTVKTADYPAVMEISPDTSRTADTDLLQNRASQVQKRVMEEFRNAD